MDDLDAFLPDQLGRAEDKPQLKRPLRGGGIERDLEVTDSFGEFPPFRPCKPDALAQLAQAGSQLNALVIRAAAGEQRIKMEDAHRL
jgi:hypothetical protein